MRFLLDTNVLLFWLQGSPRIKKRIREQLIDPANVVFVSAVSAFEVAVKASLGRLVLPEEPATLLTDFFERSGLTTLAVDMRHSFGVYALPHHHSDPFDRLLISQARIEGLTLVTSDRQFTLYDVKVALVN